MRLTAGMLLAGAAALALTGRGAGQPPAQVPLVPKAVVDGNTAFAFDLYGRLAKQDGNLFYSPYSISTALAMTYAGARGQTETAMSRTLHFTLPQAELHPAFAGLMRHVNDDRKDRKFQLVTANRLWGQQGYSFLKDFLKLTHDQYGAGLEEVDYIAAREQARQKINAWVEKQTREKIKDLVPLEALDEQTRLVLTNAIYFKASWANAFPEGATFKDKFRLAGGGTVEAPFMLKTERLPYFDNDQFQAVLIPYEHGQLYMTILLPRQPNGLAELEKQLTAARLKEWQGKLALANVTLTLPKFKFTSTFNLKQVLTDMGMGVAFSKAAADFSGMTDTKKLYISEVIHKAFVDVHESGTEAAAATAVIMKGKSRPPQLPERTVRADRPFVFLIQEARTGSVLFAGRVANPVAK